MTEKTTVTIIVQYNGETIHTTEDAVIDTSLARQVKGHITKQADGMIETLNKAQMLPR